MLKLDPNLGGQQVRRVTGSDGTSVREFKLVIEDGEVKERTFVKQYMEPEVVDNVIYFSSAAASTVGFASGVVNIAEVKHVWATWYNPASSGKPLGHEAYNVTKTGTSVERGIVAVDPNVIPLGTRMFIPGYGFAIAADTGGGIIGDMVDLGFPDGVQSTGILGLLTSISSHPRRPSGGRGRDTYKPRELREQRVSPDKSLGQHFLTDWTMVGASSKLPRRRASTP